MRFGISSRWSWLSVPVLVVGLLVATVATSAASDGVTASVGPGWHHSCLVRSDATAWCWGFNVHGELGDGNAGGTFGSVVPVQVIRAAGGNLTKVTAVTAGREHSCALRNDTTVWCWGYAGNGEMGDGTTGDPSSSVRLGAAPVQSGGDDLTGVKAISAGTEFTCALKTGGTVWCWGSDYYGQLGDGTTGDTNGVRLLPVQVMDATGHGLTHVTAISAGWQHACAVRDDGTVWCWGLAVDGELGNTTTPHHYETKAVQARKGSGPFTKVRSVSAGTGYTCAVRTDASAWCWGANANGELGDGTTTARFKPVQVVKGSGKLTKVKSIVTGSGYGDPGHTCGLLTDGTVWCWGNGAFGQLGDGTTGGPSHHRAKPVQVLLGTGKLTSVKGIGAGGVSACAVRTDGGLWCWGDALAHDVKPVKVHLPTPV